MAEGFLPGQQVVRSEFVLGGRKVDLKKLTCPVLNIFATDDHIIPPATSRALGGVVGNNEGLQRAGAARRSHRRLRGRQIAKPPALASPTGC